MNRTIRKTRMDLRDRQNDRRKTFVGRGSGPCGLRPMRGVRELALCCDSPSRGMACIFRPSDLQSRTLPCPAQRHAPGWRIGAVPVADRACALLTLCPRDPVARPRIALDVRGRSRGLCPWARGGMGRVGAKVLPAICHKGRCKRAQDRVCSVASGVLMAARAGGAVDKVLPMGGGAARKLQGLAASQGNGM